MKTADEMFEELGYEKFYSINNIDNVPNDICYCTDEFKIKFNMIYKAIETVLSMLEEKDKTIDLMAEYIESKKILVDKYCYALTKETIKQYFENKEKERR